MTFFLVGIFHPGNTALVIVDMQNDFLDHEGYIAQVNKAFNVKKAREIIPHVKSALDLMRKMNFHIIHTREGHHESLLDLPANKHWRSRVTRTDPGIGDYAPYKGGNSRILTRGHPGWEIIPELTPYPTEIIIDKPGKGAFVGTSLELHLQLANIQNLVFTGVTTDVCVHTIIREVKINFSANFPTEFQFTPVSSPTLFYRKKFVRRFFNMITLGK